MKYLDYPVLTQLSAVLSSNPSPESRTNARVEAYSIKPGAKERKMFKEMEEAYVSGQEEMEEMSFSPEMKEAGLSSCFGRLDVKESRKVHWLLVSTLNTAFPEYDFAALRPDHFMREISAAQVLSHLSNNLLCINTVDLSPISNGQAGSLPKHNNGSPTILATTLSPSLTGSPPKGGEVGNVSLYRILNDILPLQECEVYSWFPEPEYDPHVDPEENEEASEYEDDDSEELMDLDDSMDIDIDGGGAYVSWGQAGMELELDDVPSASSPAARNRTFSSSSRVQLDDFDLATLSPRLGASDGSGRRVGGLLWSANYFFYSKRQKRVLFITTWCRKRPSHERGQEDDQTEFESLPLPISVSSFSPPSSSGFAGASSLSGKPYRPPKVGHHNISNARPSHRRSKLQSKLATGKSLTSSTIPIRGLTAPHSPSAPSRLATSAPAATLPPLATSGGAMTRMTAGGIKPRQTSARMLINAAASQRPGGIGASRPEATVVDDSRVRKERSGSLTPGPSAVFGLSNVEAEVSAGKRVRV